MIKEIGSEYHFENINRAHNGEVAELLNIGDDSMLCFSERCAAEAVLKDIGAKAKKALLPDYCCYSMIEPFIRCGIEVSFYNIYIKDGIRAELHIPEDCDVVLWCNYFGYICDYPKDILKAFRARGGIVIEDITHSLFSKQQYHTEIDYAVASLRKWGPVFDGGFCAKFGIGFAQKQMLTADAEYVNMRREAMMLKAEYLTVGAPGLKEKFLALYSACNKWLAQNSYGLSIDKESEQMLQCLDVKSIRKVRRDNALILHRELAENEKVKLLFSADKLDCPLFVPIAVKDDVRTFLKNKLIESNIYCPIHWPRPSELCRSELFGNELSLICDQRYNEDDMLYLASKIKEIL